MNKRLLLRLTFFILLFFTVNLLVDQVYKHIINYNSYQKDRQFREFSGTVEFLFVGDSYIQSGVNTKIIGNCFNYSAPLETYVQSYFRFKAVLYRFKKKPAVIVIPFSPASFSSNYTDNMQMNDSYWIRYVNYFELAAVKKDTRLLKRWIIGSFFSYAGNYTLFYKNLVKKSAIRLGYVSMTADYSLDEQAKEHAINRAGIYFSGKSYYDSIQSMYFEKILQLAKINGVKIVLLKTPVSKPFYEAMKAYFQPEKLDEKVMKIVNKYPDVTVLDYRFLFFEQPDCFRNPDHLNSRGSTALSLKLKEDLPRDVKKAGK